MKKYTLRTHIILAIGAALVCATIFLVHLRSTESPRYNTPRNTSSPYQELKRTWEDIFNRAPTVAYADFIETANTLPYDQAHSLAHIVGAILYNRDGIAGLSSCTSDFAFGCYHGFAGGVIERRGITGVGEFTEACKHQENVTDCEHGIGHGLVAYLGSDKLTEALELCPPAPAGSVGGCYNGVFMEYFLSTLQRDQGVPIRKLDSEALEGPCVSGVPKKFQPACYYELPAWWRAWAAVGRTSYEEQFNVIAKRCGSVVDSHLQTICFQGAGAQIGVFSKYDMKHIQAWCSMMPESGRPACLSEALNSIASAENRPQDEPTAP